MGRKKRKSTRQVIAPAVEAKGEEHMSSTSEDDANRARVERSNECECGPLDHKTIEMDGSGIRSSWFSEVKWASRRGESNGTQACTNGGAAVSSMPVPTPSTSRSAERVSWPPKAGYGALAAELNELKEQLMPAARACADALNAASTRRGHATTPEFEFRRARAAVNAYESLGETHRRGTVNIKRKRRRPQTPGLSRFVNRSAIKLANIDALLGYCLTSTQEQQSTTQKEGGSFVFVDLCGAPGGFSEYLLYRHVHPARLTDRAKFSGSSSRRDVPSCAVRSCYGFGMSLSGSNEDGKGARWDLEHLKHHHLHFNKTRVSKNSCQNRTLSYCVCNGADGSGSIYSWDNVLRLKREISMVILGEAGAGHAPFAHIVVADGGFDAQRDSDNQERMAHRIVVSQTAAALILLRPGGMFVLKMFGFREEGTRRMLRFVYDRFEKMTFVKPIVSRPASAERYLVCHGYAGPEPGWDGFLWREQMMANSDKNERSEQRYEPLEELMDSFDLQMLQLNINTCGSIVEYLRKKSAGQEGNSQQLQQKQNQNLDLNMYEAAWQLLSRSN